MGADERKKLETEIKKKDILDAAERVFFRKGYDAASMDEVAREAEYSKRTVYVYFKSKEEIYYEIMIRGYRLMIRKIEEGLRRSGPQNAVEELRCIFSEFFKFSVEHSAYFKAVMEYETNEPDEQSGIANAAREECYRLGEQMFGYMIHALKRGIEEGRLREELDVEKTALTLWACTVGVFNTGERKSRYLMDYHHTDSEAFVMAAFDLIMHAICKEERNSG